jgi:hypothetical protein
MNKNIIYLFIGLLLFSCSESPIKPEVKKGIIYGSVYITIPRVLENGLVAGSITYHDELNGLKILLNNDKIYDTALTKHGYYSFNAEFGDYYLSFNVNDTINGHISDIPFTLKSDSLRAFDCYISSYRNSDSTLLNCKKIAPNPNHGNATFQVDILTSGFFELKLLKIDGSEISTFYRGYTNPGVHEFNFNNNLGNGIYLLFATLEDKAWSFSAFAVTE